jgi:PAS domain S-box-containing protein
MSTEYLKVAMDCVGDPIFIQDKQHRFVFINNAACELFGKSREQLLEMTDYELFPKEQVEVFRKYNNYVFETGEENVNEESLTDSQGNVRTIVTKKTLYVDEAGEKYIVGSIRDITERKRIEEELLESEAKYRSVVENSLVGVYIVQDSLIRFVNRRWCEMYGYTYGEVVNKVNPLDLTPPEYKQIVKENVRKRLSGEVDHIEYESRAIRKDGKIIALKVLGSFMLYKGQPAISGTVSDITEHQKAEEALRTSQFQLSEAMDLAKIVYWEADHADNVFIHNDPFYAFYGTTAEQEGGYRMTREEYAKQFVHPDDLPLFYQFVEQNILRTGSDFVADIEHRIVRRDGEVRHVLVRVRVIRDASGSILKVYGTNQDITERKQMEKALQESAEQFRKIFEKSPIGMVMTDANFHFIRANAAFCTMFGYEEKELSSFTLKDITHPEHIPVDKLNANALANGEIPYYQTEKRYIRKDKGVIWGSSTVSIMRDRDNRFLYFFTTVEDITQRKQSEEEKARLESKLRQAQKMEAIGTLAGGIAHDFNNILTALLGYASLLRMRTNDATSQKYVDQIFSASQKATGLVQSLLAFSRQQAISLKPISLHSIIKGTEKLLKRLVTEDITIKTLLAKDDIAIMADTNQIDQILFNLATNARDAMPHGGTFIIETKIAELGDEFQRFHGYGEPGCYALLSISDTGIGMDETTQERIFDPFFTTKEMGKGTGMGLSTVYGIVKQHNGYITVYSEPDKGTVFHIYLPIVNKADKEEKPEPISVRGGNETILIAEDDMAVRNLISEVLIKYGYKIVEAIDGVDAIEQFKKAASIDLLIFDSVMPKKNGREAYNEIHKIKPDIKIIFTSGYTRDVFRDKGVEDKKFDFLQKPVSTNTLLQKVREVLDDRQD